MHSKIMEEAFSGGDPFALTRKWLDEAEKTELNDPNAIALATVDGQGLPNVRIVLLKAIDARGFIFYTNYASKKATELAENSRASFVIHWKSLRRQIRVRGAVEKEEGAQADAYFASRPLGSRLGAWASRQSEPLEGGKAHLRARFAEKHARFGDTPPRPKFWGGFRVIPTEIEFWSEGQDRLHERARWRRAGADEGWEIAQLYP